MLREGESRQAGPERMQERKRKGGTTDWLLSRLPLSRFGAGTFGTPQAGRSDLALDWSGPAFRQATPSIPGSTSCERVPLACTLKSSREQRPNPTPETPVDTPLAIASHPQTLQQTAPPSSSPPRVTRNNTQAAQTQARPPPIRSFSSAYACSQHPSTVDQHPANTRTTSEPPHELAYRPNTLPLARIFSH